MTVIGIPSGWEEIAAFHCVSPYVIQELEEALSDAAVEMYTANAWYGAKLHRDWTITESLHG